MAPPTDRPHQIAHQILFFLRFVQLGAVVLTGFVAIYFVWWHDLLREEAPRGLVVVIYSLIPAFLESYISSAYSLYKRESYPDYIRLLHTTGVTTVVSAIGYRALRGVPYVREWCEGNNWAPMTDNVEKRNCALVCVIIVAGAIAVSFTGLITLFAGIGLVVEKRGAHVRLEDLPTHYTDDEVAEHPTDEKVLDAF